MLFNLKALAFTLFTLATFAKAFGSYESYDTREFVDDDEFGLTAREYKDALDARSLIDAALSSLSTRALISELNDRLDRRALSVPQQVLVTRCKRELANAAGKKVSAAKARTLEDCLKSLFDLEGTMPVANWQVEGGSPPPSPKHPDRKP